MVIIRPWIYGPRFSACVCVELENMDLGLVCMWDRDSYLLCVREMGVYGPRFSVCVFWEGLYGPRFRMYVCWT